MSVSQVFLLNFNMYMLENIARASVVCLFFRNKIAMACHDYINNTVNIRLKTYKHYNRIVDIKKILQTQYIRHGMTTSTLIFSQRGVVFTHAR